jgi:hypothetical protein
MKTFKQLIAEVAQPNNEDELNFKEKHTIEVIDHPVSNETQHSAEKRSSRRRADYDEGEDEEVYEAKLDPVGKEDDDIDNDGDVDSSDEYLHARRKAIAKAMKKEATQSPYAIGMASAMKQTGDKPPLKKSTITKAHKIAKSIEKNESDELSESEQMAAIGRKLQKMAPKEKNDTIANAMANLGDHLESFGTPFGAKTMKELEKKTGMTASAIQALIKKASAMKEAAGQIDEISRDLARSYIRKASADNKERKAGVMKPFPMKDMEKNVSAYNKMKSREAGIETAGKKVYGIGGKARISATESSEQIDEMKQPFAVVDTADGNKVVATASDEQGAKRSIASAERPPMSIKDKSTLKIVKTRKKQDIGYPLSEDVNENLGKASKKMKFWFNTNPRDVKNRLKNADPAFVDSLAKQPEGKLGGPAELQRRLAVKMKKEETDLTENFKSGAVKLGDGSSVIVKEQDAKLLNQMFADLNADNKKRMMKVAMTDKKGFNEILGFAREAL